MKGIVETKEFKTNYRKRIAKNEQLKKEFLQSIRGFLDDRSSVSDHQLKGKMKLFRAFSINDDYRIVYIEEDDRFIFLNVGTHKEVYF